VTRRLVILTEIISPYRIPLFNAIAGHEGLDTHVIFLAETDPDLRQWQVYKEEIRFSYEVLPSWRKRIGKYNALLNRGVGRALRAASPDCVLCGGYSYLASWQALRWSRSHHVPFLLWSESNLQDRRAGHAAVEFLKTQFLRRCTGFVVPGKSAGEYLRAQGLPEERIFTAPNAVDNQFFAQAAEPARANAAKHRTELSLPTRYFLFVGRLVREKGVFDILAAYATLDAVTRANVGLIFVGDGAARRELQQQAQSISPGMIKFAGFAQREQLAIYYALADVMILPTYTDTWGLVVNEAMACGLPVIVSRAAGCAADLVIDGWNGMLVPSGDVPPLCAAMKSAVDQPALLATMGSRSRQHILEYSPQSWASGMVRAVQCAGVLRG
jgi:glycosyltransferase involved in cell wall biosynthesis